LVVSEASRGFDEEEELELGDKKRVAGAMVVGGG
jgi:hypothetical protein